MAVEQRNTIPTMESQRDIPTGMQMVSFFVIKNTKVPLEPILFVPTSSVGPARSVLLDTPLQLLSRSVAGSLPHPVMNHLRACTKIQAVFLPLQQMGFIAAVVLLPASVSSSSLWTVEGKGDDPCAGTAKTFPSLLW